MLGTLFGTLFGTFLGVERFIRLVSRTLGRPFFSGILGGLFAALLIFAASYDPMCLVERDGSQFIGNAFQLLIEPRSSGSTSRHGSNLFRAQRRVRR